MNNLDVLFIKPGSQKQLYGDLSKFKITAIEPPMWAALMAACLKQKSYNIAIFDAEIENWSYEETAYKINDANPLLIVIVVSGTNPSASTMNMTGAGLILKYLHEINPEIKTALAGLHPSVLPERTLQEEKADFVCVGEGIYTLPKLIDFLKNGTGTLKIPGLCYRQNGNIILNKRAQLVQNLDELPMPAWDYLPMHKYRAHNWHCFDDINNRQPYGVIYTSLGCPFKCNFCCINSLFGKPGIRYRSPENVITEIDFLVIKY